MPAYRLTAEALEDLRRIGRYTHRKWGGIQRRHYLASFEKRFSFLARHPHAGSACDEIRPGYRKVPEGQHMIFYRIGSDDVVEIIRVLHARMDVEKHIAPL
jgi:toxin ParE1/3/4